MAQSVFPTLIISVFEPSFWKITSATLTQETADLRYLKFPIAQGSEIFPSNLSVSGTTSLGTTSLGATTINNNSLIITDGTTTNTMNKTGYTTKNTTVSATHYLNFSDSSATGIGAIQKSANFTVNPSTGALTTNTLGYGYSTIPTFTSSQIGYTITGTNNYISYIAGTENILSQITIPIGVWSVYAYQCTFKEQQTANNNTYLLFTDNVNEYAVSGLAKTSATLYTTFYNPISLCLSLTSSTNFTLYFNPSVTTTINNCKLKATRIA